MAPGAKWIGCRNMDQGNGTPERYLECMEWFLAPYPIGGGQGDPLRAPDITINAWHCPSSEGLNRSDTSKAGDDPVGRGEVPPPDDGGDMPRLGSLAQSARNALIAAFGLALYPNLVFHQILTGISFAGGTLVFGGELSEFARRSCVAALAIAFLAVAVLLFGEVRWAHDKTPPLFDGLPHAQARAAESAGAWLASTSRPDDVLLGYEPLFLRAWERNRSFSSHVLPRADPRLFASALKKLPRPLGRGVWVFDASDTTNARERQTIAFALPRPSSAFEGRVFGPYLVIRSRAPLLSPPRYLAVAERVMRVGRRLEISDADVNLQTMLRAEARL